MFSRNSIHPLPRDVAHSTYINGDHDHTSSYYQKDKMD